MNLNTTRRGKIARLPLDIRRELNQRLENGEEAGGLLPWLNGLEPVKQITRDRFGDRAITAQNLSEWRKGGFLDWQRQQDACEMTERWCENSQELEQAGHGGQMSRWIATAAGVQLAAAFEALQEQTLEPGDRWERLKDLLNELHRLRREDHRAARLHILQASSESRLKDQDEARKERAHIRDEEKQAKRRKEIADEMRGLVHFKAEGYKANAPALAQYGASLIYELDNGLKPGSVSGYFEEQMLKDAREEHARQAAEERKAAEQEQAQRKAARVQRAAEKRKAPEPQPKPEVQATPPAAPTPAAAKPVPTRAEPTPKTDSTNCRADSCASITSIQSTPNDPGQSSLIQVNPSSFDTKPVQQEPAQCEPRTAEDNPAAPPPPLRESDLDPADWKALIEAGLVEGGQHRNGT